MREDSSSGLVTLRPRRVALAGCFGYARPERCHAVAAIQEIV
ncbi:hypothetical protein SPMU_11240 [Sphingomonas mucosissima]|uniref:Uncharacterized protein n=1 Tax=Sphingomonas mucosissima TaxID=370959 RepID=A0A245ZSQ7_9SPHN|nr:hypothetical protein SPMU_11240 [Sphingomonas mucosissima]